MTKMFAAPDGCSLRSYEPGDETAIVALFNSAYRGYGGYVPRDEDYWRWCVLGRPGVGAENVLLLVDENDRPVAYGAISGEGSVLEFAVTAEALPEQRRRLAGSLLEAIEDRGRTLGLDTIQGSLPLADESVRHAAEAAGYRMEPMESLQLVVVDVVALLGSILRERAPILSAFDGRAAVLEIEPGRCRFLSHDRVAVRVGSDISVEAASSNEPDAVHIGLDLVTLMSIVFADHDPGEAIRSGSVRIRAEEHNFPLALLSALVVSDPWYVPHADGR